MPHSPRHGETIRTIETSAPGKVILFGEHFVVWGGVAVSLPTRDRVKAKLTFSPGKAHKFHFASSLGEGSFDQQDGYRGSQAFRPFTRLAMRLLDTGRLPAGDYSLILENPLDKGMGSSAALAACASLALRTAAGMELDDGIIVGDVDEAEKVSHNGRASGIDAWTVVTGHAQRFRIDYSHKTPMRLADKLELSMPIGSRLLLLRAPGSPKRSTGELVEAFGRANGLVDAQGAVYKPKEVPPAKRRALLNPYKKLLDEAIPRLTPDGDPSLVGNVMRRNHKLLASVSTPDIDRSLLEAETAGAWGGKLTGAGGEGGSLLVIAPDAKWKALSAAMAAKGLACRVVGTPEHGVWLDRDDCV